MDADVGVAPDPATLEAEDFPDDTSDYESVKSDTTSATSSIFDYTYENGRRYHAYKAGSYLLPNDDAEQDRLDLQHHIFTLLLDGELAATKLYNPQRILDLGCGTGIWAIEMGEQHPSAKVEGLDLSPIQPAWVPPNVEFVVDDITQEWTYPDNSIDFIHMRTLHGSIRDWPGLLAMAFRALKPGGRIEVSEIVPHFHCDDGSLQEDSYSMKWDRKFHEIAAKIEINFDEVPNLPGWLAEAGFTSVDRIDKVLPCGTWPKDKRLKEIGKFYRVFLLDAMESYSIGLFTRHDNWSQAEVQVLLAHVKREVLNSKIHTYTKACFVTGQKPVRTDDYEHDL